MLGRGAGHSFALSYLGPVVLSTVDVLEESHFTACSKLANFNLHELSDCRAHQSSLLTQAK